MGGVIAILLLVFLFVDPCVTLSLLVLLALLFGAAKGSRCCCRD